MLRENISFIWEKSYDGKIPSKNCLKNFQANSSISGQIDHSGNTSTVCEQHVKNTDIHLPDSLQNAPVQFKFNLFTVFICYASRFRICSLV